MTKYEKLKYICDTIWHEATFVVYNWEITNEKDVIFTQDFMNNYFLHRRNVLKSDLHRNIKADLIDNLDNPIDYLFDLMWWKQKQ
jgi:hypothetical protein